MKIFRTTFCALIILVFVSPLFFIAPKTTKADSCSSTFAITLDASPTSVNVWPNNAQTTRINLQAHIGFYPTGTVDEYFCGGSWHATIIFYIDGVSTTAAEGDIFLRDDQVANLSTIMGSLPGSVLARNPETVRLTAVGRFSTSGLLHSESFQINSHDSVTLRRTDGAPPTQPPYTAGDYTPTKIEVRNLGPNSVELWWETKKGSNSEVRYGTSALNKLVRKDLTFDVHLHNVKVTGLSPDTTYFYTVGSSPDANTTSSQSVPASFRTKKADGTGGSTGEPPGTPPGPTGPPPPTPGGVNAGSGVGVGKVNLDQNLGTFQNLLTIDTVEGLVTRIINILLGLIAVVAIVMIIVSGFRMTASNGNAAALTAAKKSLYWAILGLVVALMSFSIVAILQSLIKR